MNRIIEILYADSMDQLKYYQVNPLINARLQIVNLLNKGYRIIRVRRGQLAPN